MSRNFFTSFLALTTAVILVSSSALPNFTTYFEFVDSLPEAPSSQTCGLKEFILIIQDYRQKIFTNIEEAISDIDYLSLHLSGCNQKLDTQSKNTLDSLDGDMIEEIRAWIEILFRFKIENGIEVISEQHIPHLISRFLEFFSLDNLRREQVFRALSENIPYLCQQLKDKNNQESSDRGKIYFDELKNVLLLIYQPNSIFSQTEYIFQNKNNLASNSLGLYNFIESCDLFNRIRNEASN